MLGARFGTKESDFLPGITNCIQKNGSNFIKRGHFRDNIMAGSHKQNHNFVLGLIFSIILVFLIRQVTDGYSSRKIKEANELNESFMRHLQELQRKEHEQSIFVEISHSGNPGNS